MKKNYIDKYHYKHQGWLLGAIWPSLIYLVISGGLGVIGAVIATVIAIIKNIDPMKIALSGTLNMSLTLLAQIITIAIILPIYLIFKKKYFPKPKQKPTIKMIICSICLIFLVGIPSDILLSFIQEHFIKGETGLDMVNEIISSAPIILSTISVVILAPIVEEIMIRGLTLNKILSAKNVGFAIIVSGVIFGIIHMNILQGLFATIAGIALAYVFVKTKSLIPCIICHFANNLLSIIELNLTDKTCTILNIVLLVISIIPAIIFIKEKEIEYE